MSPDILQDLLPEFGMTQRAPGKADDNHAFRQGTLLVEIEQGGENLAVRQIAGSSENDKKSGLRCKAMGFKIADRIILIDDIHKE